MEFGKWKRKMKIAPFSMESYGTCNYLYLWPCGDDFNRKSAQDHIVNQKQSYLTK